MKNDVIVLSSCHKNVPEKIVPECYHQLVKILDLTSESWFQIGPNAISRRHISLDHLFLTLQQFLFHTKCVLVFLDDSSQHSLSTQSVIYSQSQPVNLFLSF